MTFEISTEAKSFLRNKDPYMRALIDSVGEPEERAIDDPFKAMIVIITGQQISEKAADSIIARIFERFNPITQKHFSTLSVEDLRSVGLSRMKASTILRLAKMDDLSELRDAPKETVEKRLLDIKGVGRWSVEMFHFVCRQDPHILSLRDIGIVNALRRLYDLDKDAPLDVFKDYFHPYQSVAASYLWKLLEVDDETLQSIKKDVRQ